jgi:4-diphosphocytidyl-2-C-methyl-D-erythritol kinase
MNFQKKSLAKVNLFLHVLGKLPNGYHQLESLAYFPKNYYDELFVSTGAGQHKLSVEGAFAPELKNVGADIFENNIIAKTISIFDAEFKTKTPPLNIKLVKNLWVAAGIGGGSGNAAAMLHILNELHGNKISLPQLVEIGLKIGADVPVCIYQKPAFFSGIGENVQILENFPELQIELCNPNIAVSTKQIFKMGFAQFSNKIDITKFDLTSKNGVLELLKATKNDLQNNAIAVCPEISGLLSKMNSSEKYIITRMSGSGATCFGVG